MQQMNSEGAESEWQAPYDGYQGNPRYNDPFANASGQKIRSEDEQFAELLARKIKQEFRSEVHSEQGPSAGQRLALAIVSLCLLVPLFGLFVVALTSLQGNGYAAAAFAWGMIAICVTIIVINAYFNYSSRSWSSDESKKNRKQ